MWSAFWAPHGPENPAAWPPGRCPALLNHRRMLRPSWDRLPFYAVLRDLPYYEEAFEQAAPYLTIAGSGLQPAEVRTAQHAAALATRGTAMHWPGCALALPSAVGAGCTVRAGAGIAVPLRSALMGTWRPSAEDCPPPGARE